MDPPRHSHYRRLASGVFTPKRAAQWRDSIKDTARVISTRCARAASDLVTDIAGKLPSYVIAEMMGQLLTRLPDMELTGEPTWLASDFMTGPAHIPIGFTPSNPVGTG